MKGGIIIMKLKVKELNNNNIITLDNVKSAIAIKKSNDILVTTKDNKINTLNNCSICNNVLVDILENDLRNKNINIYDDLTNEFLIYGKGEKLFQLLNFNYMTYHEVIAIAQNKDSYDIFVTNLKTKEIK
jgi:hypothetical protein